MTNSEFEIHPFNEAFYIESLLSKTRSILNDVEILNKIWSIGYHDCKNDNQILDLLQNIIINVGGISRFFWPSKNIGYYKVRAKKLREVYDIKNSSVLRNRSMRNHIEHFDEKLDDFLKEFINGSVMQKYVGETSFVANREVFFRAYFYDTKTFKMFNVEYKIESILAEIRRIHQILIYQQENGRRF